MLESTESVTFSRHTMFQARDQEISSDAEEGDLPEQYNGDFDDNKASEGSTMIVAERSRHVRRNEIKGRSVVVLGRGASEQVHLAAIGRWREESTDSDTSDDEVKEYRREEQKRTHNKMERKKEKGKKKDEDRRKGEVQRNAIHKRDRLNEERGK